MACTASLMEEARNDTRRSHSNSVKKALAIGDWHDFSPGPSKKPPSPWGWDHNQCARMLCPPTIEWNETHVFFSIPLLIFSHCHRNKLALRDPVQQSNYKLGHSDFPRFFWENDTMDEENQATGFLRHPILFSVSMQMHFFIPTLTLFRSGPPTFHGQPFKRC